MLMSRLLSLNPHHSVVFVVDRILLALQQRQVIVKELGDKLFYRYELLVHTNLTKVIISINQSV